MIATSQFTISVINDGATGATGPQGVSVTKVVEEYRLSDSSTELTGSGTGYTWSETKPDIPSGKYLWIRERTDLSNNTSAYGTAHCDIVISGLVFDVDRNSNAITQKVWESDIENHIYNDGSTMSDIQDRVTQTETDISGINTTISNVQTTLSTKADGSTVTSLSTQVNTISDTVGSHTQQISATNTRIDNIKLGTKNYIQNSEIFDKTKDPYTSSTAVKQSDIKDGSQSYSTGTSNKIIVSFPTLISGREYVFSYDWCRPYTSDTLRTIIGEQITDVTTTNDNDWHRNEIKFTADANTTQAEIFINRGSGYKLFVRHFQLELGNIASDWHESPEDVEDEISTVRTLAEQTADRFTWLVDDGTSSSNFTLTSRVAELISPQVVIKDPNGSATIISGGQITANSITTDMLATDAIKSSNYRASTDASSPYSAGGTYLDLVTGNLYTPNFAIDNTGGAAYINGEIIASSGSIGQNATNYWEIGNSVDYNLAESAAIKSHGTAYIQSGYWQLSNNKLNTQYYDTSATSGTLTYYKDNASNTYYDVGQKIPSNFGSYSESDTATQRWNKAWFYGRKYTGNSIPLNDNDWTYFFEIDSDGNIYEGGTKLSDKYAALSDVGSIYLPKSGGTITGYLTVEGNLSTSLSLQTNLASTSASQLTGNANTTITHGVTGTLGVGNGGTGQSSWTANGIVYASNSSTLAQMAVGTSGQVLKSNGNAAPGWVDQSTLSVGEATKATQDGNGDVISSTYRKLDNNIFDLINVTELTSGNLIVTGAARFTNGLYGDLVGNAATATSALSAAQVANNLKIQLNGGTVEGTNQFTYNGSAVKNINITKASLGLGSVEDEALSEWEGSSNLSITSVGTLGNAATHDVDTSIGAGSTSTDLPTSRAVASFVESKGYVTSSGVTSITIAAGDGISVSSSAAVTSTGTRTITNTGVRSVSTGATNGTISVNTNGTSEEVAVQGLAAWAYSNAGANVVSGVTINNDEITITKADGTSSTQQIVVTGQVVSGSTVLTDANGNPISLGSASQPVYFANGVPAQANTIPTISLNGSSTTSPSFYAPTAVGTSGQFLKSSGSGAPTWAAISKSTVGLGNVDNTSDADKPISTATQAALDAKGDKERVVHLVKGTQTATTASWTGVIDVPALYDGLMIAYYLPTKSAANATLTLTLSDGTSTGAIPLYVSGDTRMGTHYAAGSTVYLTYWSAGSISIDGTATTDNRWTGSEYWISNTNTIGEYAGACTAGEFGMARYSLILKVSENEWESLVSTSATTANKTMNTHGFMMDAPILYQSGGTIAAGANSALATTWTTAQALDSRYSCNCTNTWSLAGRSFYLVGTISNGKFYLRPTQWWADELPTTADGYYYWFVGHMYDKYRYALHPNHPIYYYRDGEVVQYTLLTKKDVGLGNVDNTADANKSVNYAATAGSATTATTATQASKDGSGNVITSTYVNLTGAQTISGAKTFTAATTFSNTVDFINTTASTSKTTGAIKVSGGAGIAGRMSANENMIGDHVVLSFNTTTESLDFTFI